jgi:transcription termination factor NusB
MAEQPASIDIKSEKKPSANTGTQMRKSLLKKRAARLAATQALYSADFHENWPELGRITAPILAQWEDSKADGDDLLPTNTMPDKALLSKIIQAFLLHRVGIDAAIDALILPGWKRARMSAVLIAALQCAGAEWLMSNRKAVILADEYTSIGETLLADDELAYLHKAIHLLCEALPREANITGVADAGA